MKRIFIMSSERSGSNLLRVILGAHSKLLAPPAIHFTTNLADLSAFYGDCTNQRILQEITGDMIVLAQKHLAPWKWPIDTDAVIGNIKRKNFWGCMSALYDTIAKNEGKTGWVCKDNDLFNYMPELIVNTEDVYVLYLVRDGRDVALSFFNAPGGPKTISRASRMWVSEQMKSIRISNIFPEKCMMIKYETLVSTPKSEVKRICDFLDIEFQGSMLSFYKTDECKKLSSTSEYWHNTNKKIKEDNFSKWKSQMSAESLRRYQYKAGMVLAFLGYEIVPNMIEISKTRYWVFEFIDRFFDSLYYLKFRIYHKEKKIRLPKQNTISEIRQKLKEKWI